MRQLLPAMLVLYTSLMRSVLHRRVARIVVRARHACSARFSGNLGLEGCSAVPYDIRVHLSKTVLQPSLPELPLNVMRARKA